MKVPLMAHRALGQLSAFGELRLWDEGHLFAKARNFCLASLLMAIQVGSLGRSGFEIVLCQK